MSGLQVNKGVHLSVMAHLAADVGPFRCGSDKRRIHSFQSEIGGPDLEVPYYYYLAHSHTWLFLVQGTYILS